MTPKDIATHQTGPNFLDAALDTIAQTFMSIGYTVTEISGAVQKELQQII